MPRQTVSLNAFNRGLISPLALARTDIDRTALSAETMTNWMPRNLGSMMLRPGSEYIGSTLSDNAAKCIPFVYSSDDTAIIEITNIRVRVWVDDEVISRPSVSSAVSNGLFLTNLTNWTDRDESGGTSAWVTGGYMGLTGNGTASAIREQEITVAAGDQGTEHALYIVVQTGPVRLRVGSSSGDDDYISETYLGAGQHSLALTPTGNFFIEFAHSGKHQALVSSCTISSSGDMLITSPWETSDLDNIRYDQSGDVVYVAADDVQQYKIERRGTRSWSVVKYLPNDGPFNTINTGPITITPANISGSSSLSASAALFKSTDVGRLFRLTSSGQTVEADVVAENNYTNAIRVTGVTSSRIFTIIRNGTWVATVTLQRSLTSDSGPWEDVTTYTTNATITYDDGLDNQIAWYRIGVKTGDFTSGTVELTLDYAIGSIDGICRINEFTNSTSVKVDILTDFGNTDATADWYAGSWSNRSGYPSSVALAEGRLGWAGKDKVWLSASDDYESFDDLYAGDSDTIVRTIGSGPVATINWMVATRRLIFGSDGAVYTMRSSSEDEPLTPTNAHIKSFSTHGSAAVNAEKLDNSAIFIQRGGTRVMEAAMGDDFDYSANDLTTFYPEAGSSEIVRIGVQMQPDIRIHCVRSDGDVSIMLHDKAENVSCWVTYSSAGSVEDVVVLPGAAGDGEDAVYYVVNRTINGSTVRYLEKWALESQCQGSTVNRQLDCFETYTSAGSTVTGLDHLEGETVTAWGDGANKGTATVSGGSATFSEALGDACVGLSYTAQFKSSKLAYASGLGTALAQKKNVTTLGVILRNTHYQGLEYGPDFTNMDNLPLMSKGAEISEDTVHSTFDEESFSFPGNWDTDSRLCLQATSPNPVTILAAIIGLETHDRY